MNEHRHPHHSDPPVPRAIHLSAHRVVDAPASDVWAVVADYERDPSWRTGVISMTVAPSGEAVAGAATVEELRLAGRTWRNEGVVTAVDAGRRLEWRTTSGADANGSRTVEALDGARCRVHLDLLVVPHGAERLFAPVLARMLRGNLRRDLDALATLVAAQASAGATSSTQSSTGVGSASSSVAAASAMASAKTASAAP